MNRLRHRLLAIFLAATLLPLAATWWIAHSLLDRSLALTATRELDEVSRSLELTGRRLYQDARERLRADAAAGKARAGAAPSELLREFEASGEAERFALAGDGGDQLLYLRREGERVQVFAMALGVPLARTAEQHARARQLLEGASSRDWRRGLQLTFALLVAVIWLAAFGLLVWLADRVTRPIEQLTRGLERLGAGESNVRLPAAGSDEAGRALASFNETSERLEQSRERLLYLARLESWQSLARKMAHELKNSLTPIRLTVEEMVARNGASDPQFLRQAAQIVTDEVTGLERRVRAFTEMAAEPPVHPAAVDLNRVVEERVTLLQAANPLTEYRRELAASAPAWADEDLLRGILTNLLENAAHAAAVVLIRTAPGEIEVHDNGTGLSETARATLFEPTISFKKAGMGLGLSIARRSALLNGGDLTLIEGELGGAAFRVRLPVTCPAALSSSTTS